MWKRLSGAGLLPLEDDSPSRNNNDEKMYLYDIIDIKKRNLVARLGIWHTVKNHISFFVDSILITNCCQERILPGERLILTFETEKDVLNSKIVTDLVNKYLK